MYLKSLFLFCSSTCLDQKEKQIILTKEKIIETDEINQEKEVKYSPLLIENNLDDIKLLENLNQTSKKDEQSLIFYPGHMKKSKGIKEKNKYSSHIHSTYFDSEIPNTSKIEIFDKNSLIESPFPKDLLKENTNPNRNLHQQIDTTQRNGDMIIEMKINRIKSELIIHNVIIKEISFQISKNDVRSSWNNSIKKLQIDSFQIKKKNREANLNKIFNNPVVEKRKEKIAKKENLDKPNKISSISVMKNCKFFDKKISIPQVQLLNTKTKIIPTKIKLIDDIKGINSELSKLKISNNHQKQNLKTNSNSIDKNFIMKENQIINTKIITNLENKNPLHFPDQKHINTLRNIARSKTEKSGDVKNTKNSSMMVNTMNININ